VSLMRNVYGASQPTASCHMVSLLKERSLSYPATPPRRSRESPALRVRLHPKPGQKGTKQLRTQYGDRLVYVRYRYDAQ